MTLGRRVFRLGRVLLVAGGLCATFVLFFVVSLRLAIRSREAPVPLLTGRSVNEASVLLDDLGLALRVEEPARADARMPAGLVLAQDPAPGMVTRRPRSVKVWLSAGPAVTVVPALVGEAERTAQLRLHGSGLVVIDVAEVRSRDYAPGTVIAQVPPPDTRAGEVAVLVNREEPSGGYVMPDLIGVDGERAAGLLRSRGFRVTVVGSQPYPGIPAGTVIRQTPAGGFQVGPSEGISLEVSR
jgi:beta-lactam-binding protein with PASTA domain